MRFAALFIVFAITLAGADEIFTEEPSDEILVRGSDSPITFTCRTTLKDARYSWLKDLNPLPENEGKYERVGGTLRIRHPVESDAGEYRCVATSDDGRSTIVSNYGRLRLAYVEEFASSQYQISVQEGLPATLRCQGLGDFKPANSIWFGWQSNNEPTQSYTQHQSDPRVYVSRRTGNLYLANSVPGDSNSWECMVKSKWNVDGKKVRTFSSPFDLQVTPNSANSRVGLSFLLKPDDVTRGVYGEDAFLECFAAGKPTPNITWSKVGGRLPESSKRLGSGLLKTRLEGESDGGVYKCTATNEYETISTTTTVNFDYAPRWVKAIESKDVDVTSTATLLCQARASPPAKILWLRNGAKLESGTRVNIVSGATQGRSELYIHDFGAADAGIYQCVANNTHGSLVSSAMLTSRDAPPEFTTQLDDISMAAVDGDLTLPCTASGSPPPEVTWYKDEAEIELFENERFSIVSEGLRISGVEKSDEGFYKCKASNPRDTITSMGKLEVYNATRIVASTATEPYYLAHDWVTLRCDAVHDADLNLKWTWTHDGAKVPHNDAGFDLLGAQLEILASGSKSGVYKCTASTEVGSDSREMVVVVKDVPSPPSLVTAKPRSGTAATVTWEEREEERVSGREVERQLCGDEATASEWIGISCEFGGDGMSCEAADLSAFTRYRFRVRAANDMGWGKWSEASECVQTLEGVPHAVPRLTRGGGGRPGELVVEWQVLNASQYGALSLSYAIEATKFNTTELKQAYESSPTQNRTVLPTEDDEIYEPYLVRIQARNSGGYVSEWSEYRIVYSGEIPPVQNISNPKVLDRKSYSAELSWNPIENRNGYTLGYEVSLASWIEDSKQVRPETWLNYTTPDEQAHIVADNLTAINPYSYRVAAFNSQGRGPWSEWTNPPFQTRKHPPNLPPRNIGIEIDKQQVTLWWDAVPTQENQEPVLGYKIHYWEAGSDEEDVKEVPTLDTHIVMDLPRRYEYLLNVQAYSRGGDGPKSNIVRFSTSIGTMGKQTGGSGSLTSSFYVIATTAIAAALFAAFH